MLYAVKCELKSGYPLPPEQWLGLVLKNMEDIMKYKEQGKVVVQGAPVGRQAGYMVWDVDSNKELQTLVTQLPVWPFMEWEIVPLISTEDLIESVKQALAAVRGSKEQCRRNYTSLWLHFKQANGNSWSTSGKLC